MVGIDGIGNVSKCYFSGNTDVALKPYGITDSCLIENNKIGVQTTFNS